jgi:glycosyltransferase involved in cell wall biosynthesis
MAPTPTVAIYTPDLLAGGAQSVTTTLANGLSERGFSVDLVMPCPMGRHVAELNENVNTVFLQEKTAPVIGSASCIFKYRAYLSASAPEIVISQRTHGNVVSLLARLSLPDPPPIAITEHGHHVAAGIKGKATLKLSEMTYDRADRIICVSNSIADDVRNAVDVSEEMIDVIPNPFDIHAIRSRARDPVAHAWLNDESEDVVLSAGRLEPVKNFGLLIDSFERIHRKNPSSKLLILGEGSKRQKLTATIESKGLSDVVDLPGYVDNPYKYMKNADVFALPSRREALPSVLIEALAVGCPVVATDRGGAREILEGGKYGALVEPTGEELSESIVSTLARPPDPSRLKERADRYATSTVLDSYSSLINGVVHERDQRRRRPGSRFGYGSS